MKGNLFKKFSKIIGLIILIFLPRIPLADTLSFTPVDTDLSLNYLRSIFGTVEGAFVGTSQMLGTLFSLFNSAVLTLGGLVLIYIMVVSTLSTAHEGEVMGKKWSSIWIPLRTAIGMGLLLPKGSGYCTMQTLMMWIIVQGIGVANSVWNKALDYLAAGGTFITTPSSDSAGITGGALRDTYLDQASGLAAFYLQAATCMKILDKQLNDIATQQNQDSHTSNLRVPDILSSVNFDNAAFSALPASGTLAISLPGSFTSDTAYNVYTGKCGRVNLKATSNSNANSVKMLANEQLFSAMSALADQYINSEYFMHSSQQDTLALGAIEYYYALLPALQYLQSSASSDKTSFMEQAKKDGWLMAGSYYYRLANLGNSELSNNTNLWEFTIDSSASQDGSALKNLQYDNSAEYLVQLTNSQVDSNFIPYLNTSSSLSIYINSNSNQDHESGLPNVKATVRAKAIVPSSPSTSLDINSVDQTVFGTFIGVLSGISAAIIVLIGAGMGGVLGVIIAAAGLSWPLAKIFTGFTNLMTGSSALLSSGSPILAMAMMGAGMIDFASTAWIMGAVALVIAGSAASVGACMNPIPYGLQMLLTWFMPIFTYFIVSMIFGGALLLLYIPFIPCLVFLFAALGWFFSVIEAMVAAPLVALFVVYPEGHEAFGKAESAIMLTLNVFLRPVLMVIAFLIATILSYVGVWMLNKAFLEGAFWTILDPTLSNFTGAIFAFPLMLVVYGMFVMWMEQTVFELIPKIPDGFMQWFGGPAVSYGSQTSAGKTEALKSGVGGAAHGLGQAGASGFEAGKKSLEKKNDKSSSKLEGENKEGKEPEGNKLESVGAEVNNKSETPSETSNNTSESPSSKKESELSSVSNSKSGGTKKKSEEGVSQTEGKPNSGSKKSGITIAATRTPKSNSETKPESNSKPENPSE